MNEMIPVPDIMQSDSLPPADESVAPHMRTTALLWCWWWCFFHRHAASFDLVLKDSATEQLPQQTTAAAVSRFTAVRAADHAELTALNGQFCFQGSGFKLGGGEGHFETAENLDIILVTDSWTINTSKYNNVII